LNQTTLTNLAAGATAEVLLTVSDATVGEYVVNVTAASSGNPSVSDTISTLTNVSVVAKPDLLVTEINLTSGALFAGQSNEICATVKNNGTADAGAFNVSFLADGFSEEVRVNGLAVGGETTVCVTDPTSRTAGDSVTVTVTADSGAEIAESDETNNERSAEVTVVIATNGSIRGTIIYACNGALGIADVTVNLTQDGSVIASTTTDGNGNYTFTDVTPGEYYVNASKSRLWDNSTSVMIAGGTVTADMTLLLKGDLNNNCLQADAGDVAMMKDASVGKIPSDWRFDLNGNGIFADAGDVAMMKDASVGKIDLV
jgi:hypothetical protein